MSNFILYYLPHSQVFHTHIYFIYMYIVYMSYVQLKNEDYILEELAKIVIFQYKKI